MKSIDKTKQNQTPEKGNSLTGKQVIFLSHLLASHTVEEACKKAKIGRATYYQWLKDETFREELIRQRKELVDEAFGLLKGTLIKAVEEMTKLLDEPNPAIRRLACKDVIEFNFKAIELQEIQDRLGKIEEYILSKGNANNF
jgi:hypothetical protein